MQEHSAPPGKEGLVGSQVIKTASQAAADDRAKRVSQLTMPLDNYTGNYGNDIYGTIVISNKENNLSVKMGNIHCISTPFKEPETIRVEMIPGT